MGSVTPVVPGEVVSGIDVSHFQGVVDWNAVAAQGIAFAFAKATEGTGWTDARFAGNWDGMKEGGIIRGAYHFFRPATPAADQAAHFVGIVKSIEAGDLPPVLDVEEATTKTGHSEWDDVRVDQRVSVVLTWLQEVEQLLGRKPILYTRRGFVENILGDPGPLTNYPLWVAHYTTAAIPAVPEGWTGWTFWQYSQSGHVGGIETDVDLDRFNGSLAALQDLTGAAP